MSLGERIKKARRGRFTQDELAERLNVSRQLISKWERNKSEPNLRLLSKLAEELEVSRDFLIDGVLEED